MVLDILSAFKIFLPTNVQTIREEPLWNKEKQGVYFSPKQRELAEWPEDSHCSFWGLLIWAAGDWTGLALKRLAALVFLDSWRYQLSPTGCTSSSPTQDGEQTRPSIWGGPSGPELASLCGGWRREAAEATLSASFLLTREQLSSSRGEAGRILTVWGLSYDGNGGLV